MFWDAASLGLNAFCCEASECNSILECQGSATPKLHENKQGLGIQEVKVPLEEHFRLLRPHGMCWASRRIKKEPSIEVFMRQLVEYLEQASCWFGRSRR